jgi:hypothetical protein
VKRILTNCLLAILAARGSIALAQNTNFVAPSEAAIREGDTSASPLDFGVPSRFQQVYDAVAFNAFTQGVIVRAIAFRGDGFNGHGFGTTVSNIEVHFSTTSRSVNSLSPVFDQNVGIDNKMVVGQAPFRLEGDGGTDGTKWPFSTVFLFDSDPFIYYPSAGNLLLDIKVFTGIRTAPFDAFDRSGDTVSSVFGFGPSFPSSGQASSLGLATQFFVRAVPEPSAPILFAVGITALSFYRRWRFARPREGDTGGMGVSHC